MHGAQRQWGDSIAAGQRLVPLRKQLPGFLPGRMLLRLGRPSDYAALERFHYRGRRPATWAGVICIEYVECAGGTPWRGHEVQRHDLGRIVGVGVLSWPTAVSRPRREVFHLDASDYGRQVRWANANVRTISRVIVHPQFRGLGLARILVEGLCAICRAPYAEARAAMASVHPLFERAGMRRHDCGEEAAYFWKELRGL